MSARRTGCGIIFLRSDRFSYFFSDILIVPLEQEAKSWMSEGIRTSRVRCSGVRQLEVPQAESADYTCEYNRAGTDDGPPMGWSLSLLSGVTETDWNKPAGRLGRGRVYGPTKHASGC